MRCLRADQIYLYLEEEFSLAETKEIEKHIASCSRCKNAVEEREKLLQASESLPLWELPPDFSRQVMAQIFPRRVTLRSWIGATAIGLSSTVLALFGFFLLSGSHLAEFLIRVGHVALDVIRTFSVFLVKAFKLLYLLIKIIVQFSGLIINGLARLTAILSPEVQIILITLTLILSATLFFGVRRKIMIGAKQ